MIGFSPQFSPREILKQKVLLGNDPTPEFLGIIVVYLIQGVLGLTRLAVSFFLKDDLALSPAEVSALMGVVTLPWIVKPLWGFISDGLPILGYRRRPYLILSGVVGALGWILLATVADGYWSVMGALTLTSLSVALSDVIADSLVVERARGVSTGAVGSLQSVCWGASAIGGLTTAYMSGWLLEVWSPQKIFGLTAILPVVVAGVAAVVSEVAIAPTTDPWQTIRTQVQQLKGAIVQPAIWKPTLFVLLWQCTPSSDAAFFFFTTNELGFEPEFLGRVRLVTSIAALLGLWLFQKFFKSVPIRSILGWSAVIATFFGLTPLMLITHTNRLVGIGDRWFSIGDSAILTVMGEIAFMPLLVLSAQLCPRGIEATFFALLMSIFNLGYTISQELGAILMHSLGVTPQNFDHLAVLVLICNFSSLLPLIFVRWLPGDRPIPPQTEDTPDWKNQISHSDLLTHHLPGSQPDSSYTHQPIPQDLSPSLKS